MLDLFVAMVREEWRVHTSLFGNFGFALFPFLLLFFSFAGALIWPLFTDVMPTHQAVLLTHYSFALAGASVGAFGLFGREVMNRRFGQASLIAYSSRSLPISEQSILLNFVLKDTVYYLFFWVFPFVAGVGLAAPLIGIAFTYIPLLLVTLSLSFLVGLSFVFLLSTIYVHSFRALVIAVLIIIVAAVSTAHLVGTGIAELLPPLLFFTAPTLLSLLVSVLLIVVPIAISVRFLKIEFKDTTRRFTSAFTPLTARLRWSSYAHFVAKDALDLSRSEGGVGKIVFSFLLPVLFIWLALFVLGRFIPGISFLMVFAILLGVISSTIYNWVTEFDLFASYTFLPVRVSTVIKAKLHSYFLLNLVSAAILLGAGISSGEPVLLIAAFPTFAAVSFYAVAVTIYFTGLSPTLMLYNARVYIPYLALIAPVLLLLIFLSLPNPWFALSSILCIPAGGFLLHLGLVRWDRKEQQSF
ncbi:MAG: hypothetical protein LUO93_04805 [Methanomicrobiales archaeon]|nr:hypothetical protein [Methanomicrobiales archaeon]